MSVYANGRAIAGRAKQGKSTACFPDPCFAPPALPAPPGWTVVPFPNTAYARHTSKASKTVFIEGKPVMLKDKSYFSTSTGNEAATGLKGLMTKTKKGKAYFTSWSMDVKIEGYNVCRHMDGMDHNHGSSPANTPEWKYLDGAAGQKKGCKKEQKKIKRACSKKNTIQNNKPQKKDSGSWASEHCHGLNYKPIKIGKEKDLEKKMKNIKKSLGELEIVDQAISKASAKVQEIIESKLKKILTKASLKAFLGPAGWVWTAYDAVSTPVEIKKLNDHLKLVKNELNETKNRILNFNKTLENIKTKVDGGDYNGVSGEIADLQKEVAKINPCLRARKCMLVSYNDAKSKKKNRGCCNGQTGHHIIPDRYMKRDGKKICEKYTKGSAPTICVEGTGAKQKTDEATGHLIHRGGSHGIIHENLDNILEHNTTGGTLSYKNARNAGIKSIQQTFPLSHCSTECLKKQIDHYYKDRCKKETKGGKLPELQYFEISNRKKEATL